MNHKLFTMNFGKIYDLYVNKILRKNRNIDELNQIICWLTQYDLSEIERLRHLSLQQFFENAPKLNDNICFVEGKICGVVIQEIEDPLLKNIRIMDKLVDDLAKGKKVENILK